MDYEQSVAVAKNRRNLGGETMNFERALVVFRNQLSCTKGDPLGIVIYSGYKITSIEEAEYMLQIRDRIAGIPIPEKIRSSLELAISHAEEISQYLCARDSVLRVSELAKFIEELIANDLREQIIALGEHQHIRILVKILEDVAGEQLVDFQNGTVTMFLVRKFLKVYFRALGRYIANPQSYEGMVNHIRTALLGQSGKEGLLFINRVDDFLRCVERYFSFCLSEGVSEVFKKAHGFLRDAPMTFEEIASEMDIDIGEVEQSYRVMCKHLSIDHLTNRDAGRYLFRELGFSRIEIPT